MKNLIALWPNLSRAYEVALLGGFSLDIVANKDYKCADADYKRIKEFFNDVPYSREGISFEMYKPDSYSGDQKCEGIEEVRKRVEAARQNEKPATFSNNSSTALLKTAEKRFNLSLDDYDCIISLASTIAQLSGSDTIQIEHTAEAIMYKAPLEDDCRHLAGSNLYILHYAGCVEPIMHGPYNSEEERDRAALEIYNGDDYDPDDDQLLRVDGKCEMRPFGQYELESAPEWE